MEKKKSEKQLMKEALEYTRYRLDIAVESNKKLIKQLNDIKEKLERVYSIKELVIAETFEDAYDNRILNIENYYMYTINKGKTFLHEHPYIEVDDGFCKFRITKDNFNNYKIQVLKDMVI